MHLVLKDEKQFGFQDALWKCLLLQRSERGFMSVSDSHGNIKQTFMECFCLLCFFEPWWSILLSTTPVLFHLHVPLFQSYFLDIYCKWKCTSVFPLYFTSKTNLRFLPFGFFTFLSDNYCFIVLCCSLSIVLFSKSIYKK